MQKSPIATPNLPKRPRQPRKPKAEHLCMTFPDWIETTHPGFWLAAFLIDLTEQLALTTLFYAVNTPKGPKVERITEMAINSAATHFASRIVQSAEYTRDDGMLLYAWPGTKFFDGTKPQ